MSVPKEISQFSPALHEQRLAKEAEARAKRVRLLCMVLGVLSSFAGVGLVILQVQERNWQLVVLIVLHAFSAAFGFLGSGQKISSKFTNQVLGGAVFTFGITALCSAFFLSGFGYPVAIAFFIFSLFVSAIARTDLQSNLLLGIGMLTSGAAALASDFSPFQQVSIGLLNQVMPYFLEMVCLVYLALLVGQILTATLRTRLVTIFMVIAVIPMGILFMIQSRVTILILSPELVQPMQQMTSLVMVFITVAAGFIAMILAQWITNPIQQLTLSAEKIAAGSPETRPPSQRMPEFELLSNAFIQIAGQRRGLTDQLESHLQERTREVEAQNQLLANQTRQLQTVSQVARQVVSAQALETLLGSVTQLISERFGFYHVGIFLLDENKKYAVLRSANSAGGQRMLERQHMLPVGKVGIVGYTTSTGEPKIITDTGGDAVYFNNPDLPLTRSEMTLPLKIGEQIIGALDIQSTQSNDFHPEDIELFTTLADQVAIAIYNNQLYTDTRLALEEAQSVHRQYLRSEWVEDLSRRKIRGYVYNQSGISPALTENALWEKVLSSSVPVYESQANLEGVASQAVMAVPISVRGETIGVIQVQDQGEERVYSEEELAVVNSIASQVAVALENARLFENTVRRAEREKKVLQITARIRATNDPEEMMKVAVSELQQALHATRAQIYIRQDELDEMPLSSNNNGKKHESQLG